MTSPTTPASADAKKATVKNLLNLAFNVKDPTAAANLVTDRYIQHNPNVPTGKAGFLQALPGFYQAFPDISWDLKQIWVDGDYVIAHSNYHYVVGDRGKAVVDIFRFDGDKIDEHWDVHEEIPAEMAHDNGMF